MAENTIEQLITYCPACSQKYRVEPEMAGEKATCAQCETEFVIQDAGEQTPAEAPAEIPAEAPVESARAAAPEPEPLAEEATGKKGPSRLSDQEVEAAVQELAETRERVLKEIGKVIVGQQEVLDQVLVAFFAGGHCVLEGVPGLAKTLMVSCLSQTLNLDFKRVQFTPDLMPSDITGTQMIEEDERRGMRFVFKKGPVFTNILLADEINRTPPKTQASLLEAMQERRVTSGGKTYTLPKPFLVLATQNPLEQEGTYPLPEAQLDRFLFLVMLDYPELEHEVEILLSTTGAAPDDLNHLLDGERIQRFQALVRQVPVSPHVAEYTARLVRATRPANPDAPDFVPNLIRWGCGPRAGQALLLAAKSHAVLQGRFSISCEDVRSYALPALRHRIGLTFAASSEGLKADDVIRRILKEIPESKEKTAVNG
ncbi:MAG: AAA family ATPase [Kiritimatiellia bacterium]